MHYRTSLRNNPLVRSAAAREQDPRRFRGARLANGEYVLDASGRREVIRIESTMGPQLGEGNEKIIFALGADKVLGLYRSSEWAADRDVEISMLHDLRARGIRAAAAEPGPDLEGLPTVLYDRYAANYREDVVHLTRGVLRPQMLTEHSISSAKDIGERLAIAHIAIVDFQLMLHSDGSIEVADPLAMFDRKNAATLSFKPVLTGKVIELLRRANLKRIDEILSGAGDCRTSDARPLERTAPRGWESALGPYLGNGSEKDVFALDADRAVGVFRSLEGALDRDAEVAILGLLRAHGMRAVAAHAGSDINGLPTIVYDRYEAYLECGRQALSATTLLALNELREEMAASRLVVNPLKVLVRADGSVAIADPKALFDRESAVTLVQKRQYTEETWRYNLDELNSVIEHAEAHLAARNRRG